MSEFKFNFLVISEFTSDISNIASTILGLECKIFLIFLIDLTELAHLFLVTH